MKKMFGMSNAVLADYDVTDEIKIQNKSVGVLNNHSALLNDWLTALNTFQCHGKSVSHLLQ